MESTSLDPAKEVMSTGNAVAEVAVDAAASVSSMVDGAQKSIRDASKAVQETAQKVWSQAATAANDLTDTSTAAANSVAHQVRQQPLTAIFVAATIGYIASLMIHRRH